MNRGTTVSRGSVRPNGTRTVSTGRAAVRQRSGQRTPFTANGESMRALALAAVILLMIVFTVLRFTENNVRDVSLDMFRLSYTAEMSQIGLSEINESGLLKRVDAAPSAWDEWLYFGSDSLMEVSELLIVKCEDEASLTDAETAVNGRLAAQKTSFEGYGTNQTELLNGAVITMRGQYLFYAVGENADRWEEEFLSHIR